jgi:hypothetical protein
MLRSVAVERVDRAGVADRARQSGGAAVAVECDASLGRMGRGVGGLRDNVRVAGAIWVSALRSSRAKIHLQLEGSSRKTRVTNIGPARAVPLEATIVLDRSNSYKINRAPAPFALRSLTRLVALPPASRAERRLSQRASVLANLRDAMPCLASGVPREDSC